MKITIDTKEDSHDEIKKVINMLQHLVNAQGSEVLSDQPEASPELFNMFGGENDSSETQTSEPEQETSTSELLDDSQPSIEPY